MDPADLDRRLDRELRALPRPRAPLTLVPRVMAAAARQAAAPAPAPTGWSTWPRSWQTAALAALVAVCAGIAWLLTAPPAPVAEMARTAGETAALMRVLWDVLLQPAAPYLLVLGVAFALACAAAWAALDVALGGASQS
ncbi:MAG TPA: hypothetical protein VMN81_09875 [Vicinamibacterales bacterium]|nr:hypothetical protein [Vicinamibacterales bacterium]